MLQIILSKKIFANKRISWKVMWGEGGMNNEITTLREILEVIKRKHANCISAEEVLIRFGDYQSLMEFRTHLNALCEKNFLRKIKMKGRIHYKLTSAGLREIQANSESPLRVSEKALFDNIRKLLWFWELNWLKKYLSNGGKEPGTYLWMRGVNKERAYLVEYLLLGTFIFVPGLGILDENETFDDL